MGRPLTDCDTGAEDRIRVEVVICGKQLRGFDLRSVNIRTLLGMVGRNLQHRLLRHSARLRRRGGSENHLAQLATRRSCITIFGSRQ
jgi:hypothetical protein